MSLAEQGSGAGGGRHHVRTPEAAAKVPEAGREGFVLLVVMFVLLALFALTAPFLGTARNADAASHFDADGAQLRLALDGAGRHARYSLEGTHPSIDTTPYFDGADELGIEINFPPGTPGVNDVNGVAFDAQAADLAGRIDLNSAPPQVLANLLGAVARLSEPIEGGDDGLKVSSPEIFSPEDVVVIEGELIQLVEEDEKAKKSRMLKVGQRGVGAFKNKDDEWETTGPLPPRGHGIGAYVFDQRALAPVTWRTLSVDGRPQMIDAIEEIRAAESFSMSGDFSDADLRVLRRTTTPFGGIGAGATWQRPTRLTVPLEGGVSYQLRTAQGRWLVPGSTVRIENGITSELRVVMARERDGRVLLDRAVEYDYQAFATEVRVLAKRPVNVNTAPPEVLVALFTNLKLIRQNHRIQSSEARALAARVIEQRPYDSFEDFARRLVFPAAGIDAVKVATQEERSGLILDDARDAAALYYNALNANDARLEFATMPLCFTTRNLFELELRANVSARSGVERATGVRERVELVVPQRGEMLHLFARQEDFDESLRLTRGAPYWLTGPEPTGRYDGGVYPPSRAIPHLGTRAGSRYIPGIDEPIIDGDDNIVQPDRIFADRVQQAYVQLDPIRLNGTGITSGRILHFDLESRSVEGRFLPDQAVIRDAAGGVVRWVADPALPIVEPLNLNMWIKPEVAGDGTLLSVGNRGPDSDRIIFGMSGGNLVLRVFDGMGDHRDTPFEEVAEVRVPVASGAGVAGVPANIWSHVSIDVRGNRPDQMTLLVNGNASGVEVQGMTRLLGPLNSGGTQIAVESTEGFPQNCVLRIGSEIIEATVSGPSAFSVVHNSSGVNAGYGGRLARVAFDVEGSPNAAPGALAAAGVSGAYAAGTPVVHYGYSLPVTTDIPPSSTELTSDLGAWRVAKVVGLQNDNSLEPIQVVGLGGSLQLGRGWIASQTGLMTLALGDAPDSDPSGSLVSAGFSSTGGYAAVMGRSGFTVDGAQAVSINGSPIQGVEVVRYAGIVGNQLQVVERGVQLQRFASNTSPFLGGAREFVFDWDDGLFLLETGEPLDTILNWQTFCMPISLPVQGAGPLVFVPPVAPNSQFAQITRLDDPESTEWIRYDEIDSAAGQLVRSDPVALIGAYNALFFGAVGDVRLPPGGGQRLPNGGGGSTQMNVGGQAGSGVVGALGSLGSFGLSSLASSAASANAAPRSAQSSSDWDPLRGVDPNDDYPLSRAVASILHFRGVLGTNIGDHTAGTAVMPVVPIRSNASDFERGRPGAKDPVFLVDGNLGALGIPVSIHRAHYPAENRLVYGWSIAAAGALVAAASGSAQTPVVGYEVQNTIYVAFEAAATLPLSPGPGNGSPSNATDPRFQGRIVKFPSGEMPRSGGEVAIGVGAGGLVDFGAAAVQVDEVVFGNATAFAGAGGTAPNAHAAGAGLLLGQPAGPGDLSLTVLTNDIRLADRSIAVPGTALGALPADGGLLRIGEEIVAYRQVVPGSGRIDLAVNGRGMLGTLPQAHAVTEPIHWLEGWEVTTLVADVGPDDAALPVSSVQNFDQVGTVLLNDELIHYTRIFGGALVMPRSSGEPGAMDELGPGVFRGRFGTAPASHAGGSAIINFPARYWDRYAPRYEGPDIAFFGLSIDQPGAFWNGVIWDAQESQTGGAEIVVLQRTDPNVPWDADPEDEEGLTLLENEDFEGGVIPIGAQSDRIEWRVFARYVPGSFDAQFGTSHGWKDTPRFIQLGATYTAPPRVYRSIDR